MGYTIRRSYNLKHQSPLLHFQYKEQGAALRASEVKPKLDRFLIGKLEQKGRSATPWFVGANGRTDNTDLKPALDYKLRFEIVGESAVKIPPPYGLYYGDTRDTDRNPAQYVMQDLRMTVVCFIPELLDLIDEHIAEFFIVHNFGRMQNKGFGSFLVDDGSAVSDRRVAQLLTAFYGAPTCYCFDGGEAPSWAIKAVYTMMKAGINLNSDREFNENRRVKSMLFSFFNELPNEKGMVKSNGMVKVFPREEAYRRSQNSSKPKDWYYVRALLGICDHMSYPNDLKNRKDSTTVSVKGETRDPKNNKKSLVQRLQSPIFFKVIGSKVYYIARSLPNEIYGERFVFSSEYRGQMRSITATVPTIDQLGGKDFLHRFLKYCMTEINKTPQMMRSYCKNGVGCAQTVPKKNGQTPPCHFKAGWYCAKERVGTIIIKEVTV